MKLKVNKKVNKRTPSLNDVVKKVAKNSNADKFNSAIDIMADQADIKSSTHNIPRLIKPPHKLPKIDADMENSPAFKTIDNAVRSPAPGSPAQGSPAQGSPAPGSPANREAINFSPISPFDAMTPQKIKKPIQFDE